MQIDTPTRPLTYHAPSDHSSSVKHEKRTSISWDTTLQKGINRLEIASPNPPREQWVQFQPSQGPAPSTRPTTAPHPSYYSQQHQGNGPQPIQISSHEPNRTSQDPPATPRRNKRQAWYNGPLTHPVSQPGRMVQRTSPEDSSSSEGVPTPSNSSMTEYHPAIVHSNGYVEAHPPGAPVEEHKPAHSGSIMDRPHPIHNQYQQYHSHGMSASAYRPHGEPERGPVPYGQPPPGTGVSDMTRLDALVAVATEAVGNRP